MPPEAIYAQARSRPDGGPVPFFPMNRADMRKLRWDACDIILVNGDAYVDHPSFGAALIGRLLEAQGFRVGMLAQPDWRSAEPFRALGRPRLMFGITAGNMDSMVNHYTSDKKIRRDDAYTPGKVAGARPDRAVIVYAQRCREAFKGVPLVIGGIEASLRRTAHYDYWSGDVRRSILFDAKADLLLYGNAERAIVELAHRLDAGESIAEIRDLRGSAFIGHPPLEGWAELDSTEAPAPGTPAPLPSPYESIDEGQCETKSTEAEQPRTELVQLGRRRHDRHKTVIRLPAYEAVKGDRVLYAHASRIVHREANPGNARALVQAHGGRDLWLNPPPIPLTTKEFDYVFELPYQRVPHPSYGQRAISAYEMIRNSVMIMRGCFGGCTFCSITEHEGRKIQSRSEASVLREVDKIKRVPGFAGVISDLGGPTANMYRLACKDPKIEAACRLPSCVYPDICDNLGTDHGPLIQLYRKVRAVPGIRRVFVASGLRYDLAVRSPEYVKELVTHHVGGLLKIAPEHTESGPLSKMMKPGIGTYDRFAALFHKFSKQAGKKQHLIPYFIAAHPGTRTEDMVELALWLKRKGFEADQVQAFLPSPMSTATAMYHTGKNPLKRVHEASEDVDSPKKQATRTLHKAFLRYHDPANWPLLRRALHEMGRDELIGNSPRHLVPLRGAHEGRRSQRRGGQRPFRTKHTPQGEGSGRTQGGKARRRSGATKQR